MKKSAAKKLKTPKKKKSPAKKIKKIKPEPKQRALKRILSSGEPKPFQVINQKGNGMGLIICDHASNRVPHSLKGLGLKKTDLARHIGWDIGSEDIGRYLSKTLGMTAVIATYSRLVVDLNRAPSHDEAVIETSDHTEIPGNTGLSKKAREQRIKEIFWPHHDQITKQVDRLVKKGQPPLLLSIHSFTPEMDNVKRPWHISFLWNQQEKIAKRLISEIRRNHPEVLIGENEPYTLKSDRFTGSTIHRHAEERGLPYVFVEFRQDLVDTKEKAIYWADIFIQALKPVLGDQAIVQGKKSKT